MNRSIAAEVIEEMNDLPDELQQQVLKFVVTLRQQHRQTISSNGDVLESTTEVNNSAPSLVDFSHSAVDIKGGSFDVDATPIWEMVAQISAQVPDEEWQKFH